jgi:hypothetical protein
VDNHYVTDVHKMCFLNIKELCKDYGYKPGDLIHYKLPNKSLDEGLRLLSSDHDVNEMISQHVGHGLAELYLVSFHSSNADRAGNLTRDTRTRHEHDTRKPG